MGVGRHCAVALIFGEVLVVHDGCFVFTVLLFLICLFFQFNKSRDGEIEEAKWREGKEKTSNPRHEIVMMAVAVTALGREQKE